MPRDLLYFHPSMNTVSQDILIAGSGIAGLSLALRLANAGHKVFIATKKGSADANTNFAQGGISCVTAPGDDFQQHLEDTLIAGAGLCDKQVALEIIERGPEEIRQLLEYGVNFHRTPDGQFDLGREGGHSQRRVLHAGDITGHQVEVALLRQAKANPNVSIMEHAMLIDLVLREGRCIGAYLFNDATGEIFAVQARHTVLATGGCGKVYLYTSNPDIATGDGIALAWRAGAQIADMEFIQFHPTCLYHPKAKNFLISEAVRGEGAVLTDASGTPFMERYDSRGSLAPRDIVARAIDSEMKRTGAPYCCLDIRQKGRDFLTTRFPNIYAKCLEFGIDMATDLIPVVPAAHYCCGGVKATIAGETSIPGLAAIGETACTGLHGANRLASNSMLEALVCAHATADRLHADHSTPPPSTAIAPWHIGNAVPSDEKVLVAHNWNELRTCMWDYVGIVRTDKRLARAMRRIENLRHEIRAYYFDHVLTTPMLELRNLADVARLIVSFAQQRHESRGLHYTLDYPGKLSAPTQNVIQRTI